MAGDENPQQPQLTEIEQFLDVIRATRPCCFNQPTKLIRYATGMDGEGKYRDLLICDEHFKLSPFHRRNSIVNILDISGIFKTPASEWQKDLKELKRLTDWNAIS